MKLAIFAHYDVDGVGDCYLENIFQQLLKEVDKIIVVTTSGIEGLPILGHHKIEIITRENFGYDFYSYKVGLDSFDRPEDCDQIILLNDSFYINDCFSLERHLIESKTYDIYGITASNQFSHHLQSYFLVFNRSAFATDWFYCFWNTVYVYKNKMKIVLDYEINLSVSAEAAGLNIGSCFEFGDDENPSHSHAADISKDVGLLKVDAIRNEICDIDTKYFISDDTIILRHIERTARAYKDRVLGLSGQVLSTGKNFFEYDNNKDISCSAVILHLYYFDLAEEIREHLDRIPFNFDLFITVSDERFIHHAKKLFTGSVNRLCIAVSDNKGRDVKPFIDVMKAQDFNCYDLVLKLHSKKSKYSKDGSKWRNDLYRGLIPSSAQIDILKRNFVNNKIGIAASLSSYLSNERYWGANKERFNFFCNKLSVAPSGRELFFIGGTMFWFSPKALYPLVEVISKEEFEIEENQQDGTLAHAFERLTCVSSLSINMACVDIIDLDVALSPLDVKDNKVKILND